MNAIIRKWNNWLFDEYRPIGADAVCGFRLFYAIGMLFIGFNSYASINYYAPELYNPKRSLAIWFSLPDPLFFTLLDYFILVCLILLLFGFKAILTSLLLGIALIVGNSFLYSFDKISHGNLLISFIPLIMAFSNWDAKFSIQDKSDREVNYWPVSLLSFIIGFGMLTAGVTKLITGWLNPSIQAIKFHVFKSYLNFREGMMTEFVLNMGTPFTWEVLDYVIVIFEIGFFIAVFSRKWFQRWVIIAIFFHLGVLYILDITFSRNVIAYFIFLDWIFILQVVGFKRFAIFLSKGFNLYSMIFSILALLSIKYFFGSAYLNSYLPIDKTGTGTILFGLALIIIFGSWLYRLFNRSDASGDVALK